MAVSGGSATAIATPPLAGEAPRHEVGEIGTIVVVSGDGWARLFQSLGAAQLVSGGQTMNPSTQDILQAVEACAAPKVIVLPNNGNIVMSARQVAGLTSKQVYIVPTDSLPQGVGALLSFNNEAAFETNCAAMEAAMRRVQTAEITQAVRSVQIDGINVTEGDIIGLVNGRLVIAGTAMDTVIRDTLSRMQSDQYEIITVYYGADVNAAAAEEMARRLKAQFPRQEIEVVEGGQPFYAYIISAE